MIRRPPRSTQGLSSAASDVYKRQLLARDPRRPGGPSCFQRRSPPAGPLSLIHISEPTRPEPI
eukprot:580128-Pyramimonas_sp.AAC.1